MALIDGDTLSPKFSSVSILQTDYKKVNDHGIRADFLIPKSIAAEGKRPVIVQFHGGALVCGDSLYSDWFPTWIIELAEKHSAIIVSANYRMLPESTGVEILADIDDFWRWLQTGQADSVLSSSLPTPLGLDLERVITTGESAGGFLSVYLSLTFPDELRAGIAQYPMFNQDGLVEDSPPSQDAEEEAQSHLPPLEVFTNHVSKMNPVDIVSSDPNNSRFLLGIAAVAHGKIAGLIEKDSDASPIYRDRLSQLRRLDDAATHLPRGGLVVLHGKDDPVVPSNLSERFVHVAREKLRGRQGADNIVLSLQEGSHGFDNPVHLEEEWLQEALKTAVSTWLE
ncbi:hypothetical protein PISL3812_07585 [Talaromyces islandicus]|uniref:Alpha/beta hydrolase fold-3 domain-containing protein n=1 Tax=Talaromyces islandicus TaxID=28573 RepID=A0A0U1M654_TALIS|nr:hypothetical protein PISL3812_07585 [Talaromyces islandicus]